MRIGELLSNLTLTALQSFRVNAAGTAFEAYSTTALSGLWNDRGSYNASSNTYPSSGGSGTAGAIMKGDAWTISVGGTLGGVAVNAGDLIRALVDTPGSTPSNWAILEGNLGYVPENQANKATTIVGNNSSDVFYPSTKAIADYTGRSPGYVWYGSRSTPDTGTYTALEFPVSIDTNLDTASGVFSGDSTANTNEKTWMFSFDGVAFAIIAGLELNIGKWRFEYEVIRINALKVSYSATFWAQQSGGTAYVKTFEGEITSSIDLSSKPNNIKLEIETPGAAGNITLKKAVCDIINSPPANMVTTSRWAYFEADSYSQSDGSNITTSWTDLSGNGRHMTVGGSPTFETAELGTLPIVRLGADSNDYFALPSMSALTAGTIFIVQKVTDTGTGGGHALGTGTAGHYPYNVDGLIYDGFGSTARKDSITSKITLLNTWHTMHAWSASADWALYQNGIKASSTGTNTVGFPSSPIIGFNGSSAYMKVDIAAIYIYSAKLSAANIEKQLTYIRKKWGVG